MGYNWEEGKSASNKLNQNSISTGFWDTENGAYAILI